MFIFNLRNDFFPNWGQRRHFSWGFRKLRKLNPVTDTYFTQSNNNKCSDRSMEVYLLPVLLVNYDRTADLPTDGHKGSKGSYASNYDFNICSSSFYPFHVLTWIHRNKRYTFIYRLRSLCHIFHFGIFWMEGNAMCRV